MGKNGRPYFLYFRTSFSTGMMLARTLRWVRTTPFGSAVAPEVKMISTVSSRVTATGVKADGSSARKSMSENFQRDRVPSAVCQAPLSAGELDVVAEQQKLRADDARDVAEKFVRRAVIDRHRDRSVQQTSPQRDDPLRAGSRSRRQLCRLCRGPRACRRAANPRAACAVSAYVYDRARYPSS